MTMTTDDDDSGEEEEEEDFEHALYLSGRPQMDFVAFHQATGELWEMTREPLLAIVATTSEDLAADLVTRL